MSLTTGNYILFNFHPQKMKDPAGYIYEVPHPLFGKIFRISAQVGMNLLLEFVPRAGEIVDERRSFIYHLISTEDVVIVPETFVAEYAGSKNYDLFATEKPAEILQGTMEDFLKSLDVEDEENVEG